MMNAIVAIVSLIAVAFVAVWIFCPAFRQWVEAPKYSMLQNEERFRRTSGKSDEA